MNEEAKLMTGMLTLTDRRVAMLTLKELKSLPRFIHWIRTPNVPVVTPASRWWIWEMSNGGYQLRTI